MEKEFNDHSLFTARIILGIIFVGASLGKISDPAGFAEVIKNYQLIPDFMINEFAVFLPFLELITAVMLISGIFLNGASILALLMLVSFSGALIFNISRGLNISCGCFTSALEEVTKLHYIYYILRDLVFIFIAGFTLKKIFFKKNS